MAFDTSFIITLKDRFSGTANKVARSAENMKRRISGAGRAGSDFSSRLAKNQQQLQRTRSGLIGVAVAAAGIAFPVLEAIRFEEAMAEVRKVVDFPEPDGLKKMGETVKRLSKTIPLLPGQIASVVAAGGQLGIPTEELGKFAELVSKVSIALDVAPAVAGTSFARLQNVFNITQTETVALADAINELSNSAAVSGEELIRALANKSAAAGKALGLTANETVALAGTFVSLGVNANRVGSIIDSMARRLGDSATLSKALGDSTGQLGKQIQQDIQKRGAPALIEFLEKFQKIPTAERTEVLTNVFGEFGIRLGAVIDRLDVLKKQLNITTNATQFAGSINKEFANRMDTTGAKLGLLRNKFKSLQITIGATQLPLVNFVAEGLGGLIEKLDLLAKKFPKTTGFILSAAVALVALAAAGIVIPFLFGGIATAVAGIGAAAVTAFALITANFAAAGVAALAFGVILGNLTVAGLAAGIGAIINKFSSLNREAKKLKKTLGIEIEPKITKGLRGIKIPKGVDEQTKQLFLLNASIAEARLQIKQSVAEGLNVSELQTNLETLAAAKNKLLGRVEFGPPVAPPLATVPVAGGMTQGREDKLTVRLEATNGTRVESARVESNAEVDIGVNNMAVAR